MQWACKSLGAGVGAEREMGRKKSRNVREWTADSGMSARKCFLLLNSTGLAWCGLLGIACSFTLKQRFWIPKGLEGHFQLLFSVCMGVFPLLPVSHQT